MGKTVSLGWGKIKIYGYGFSLGMVLDDFIPQKLYNYSIPVIMFTVCNLLSSIKLESRNILGVLHSSKF